MFQHAILILILTACQNAFCYNLSSDELNKIVLNKINSEAKKQLKNSEYKIKIQGSIPDITTNETNMPSIELSSISDFNPVSYRRITIKDSKGNLIKTVPINVQILVYQNVLIAKENIGYGKNLDSTNTTIEKKEISKYYDKVITQIPKDCRASRNIVKNSIIQKNFVKPKAIIEKNQNVDIVFQGKGVQITLRGKALNEGAMGDTIMVRSEKYNKTYSAHVDSNSKVTVRI